jgi:UDP-glucose 4-epimerase
MTGGTGYLGSALISRLIDESEDFKIIALVRNHDRASELEAKIKSHEKIEFIHGDLLYHNYDLSKVDVVIHLACEHNPYKCEENSGEAINVNIGGTLRLIDAVKKFGVPYFIFTSAFGVYGRQEIMPLNEDLVSKPNCAKFLITYCSEVIIRSLENHLTKFAILRLVHMFGIGILPSRIDNELTNKFAKAVSTKENLTIYGNGIQTVDIIHVRDVCNCIYKLLISPDSTWNELYNIGGGGSISINELAEIYVKVALEMGLETPVKTYVDADHYIDDKGLASVWHDISKIGKKIGWSPDISIEEGVRELIKANLNKKK